MVCPPVRGDNPRAYISWIIDRTGVQTMLYLTCIMISSVDLAHYGVTRAKDLSIWGLWYKYKYFGQTRCGRCSHGFVPLSLLEFIVTRISLLEFIVTRI